MKTYTILYMKGIGAFLDERDIEWTCLSRLILDDNYCDEPIALQCKDDHEFALLMIEFGEHKEEYQS